MMREYVTFILFVMIGVLTWISMEVTKINSQMLELNEQIYQFQEVL